MDRDRPFLGRITVGRVCPGWGSSEMKVPQGEAHVFPAPRLAPPVQPLPSSAPGSRAC
jgi:hypothetical protein